MPLSGAMLLMLLFGPPEELELPLFCELLLLLLLPEVLWGVSFGIIRVVEVGFDNMVVGFGIMRVVEVVSFIMRVVEVTFGSVIIRVVEVSFIIRVAEVAFVIIRVGVVLGFSIMRVEVVLGFSIMRVEVVLGFSIMRVEVVLGFSIIGVEVSFNILVVDVQDAPFSVFVEVTVLVLKTVTVFSELLFLVTVSVTLAV